MLPRCVRSGVTYLLTRRCIERRFLLRPSRETNRVIEYCLAVAAERTGVELHAFCAMSNHVHSVVTDVEGRLPEFLQHFHRNVAVALNAALGRTENFWASGQTSAVELGDIDDVFDKMAYVAANPTAAGLVRSPQKWPGVVTTRLGEQKRVLRPEGFFRTQGNMPDGALLKFSLPPQARHMTYEEASRRFYRELSAKVHLARARALAERREFLGPKAVLKMSTAKAAATPERVRKMNPRFAIRCTRLRKLAIQRWKAFQLAYREALHFWKHGLRDIRFPEGTWMMPRVHAAGCGPPHVNSVNLA